MAPDHRLERLYDYTKFHIGVYITATGAIITAAGLKEAAANFPKGIASQPFFYAAIILMAVAGLAER